MVFNEDCKQEIEVLESIFGETFSSFEYPILKLSIDNLLGSVEFQLTVPDSYPEMKPSVIEANSTWQIAGAPPGIFFLFGNLDHIHNQIHEIFTNADGQVFLYEVFEAAREYFTQFDPENNNTEQIDLPVVDKVETFDDIENNTIEKESLITNEILLETFKQIQKKPQKKSAINKPKKKKTNTRGVVSSSVVVQKVAVEENAVEVPIIEVEEELYLDFEEDSGQTEIKTIMDLTNSILDEDTDRISVLKIDDEWNSIESKLGRQKVDDTLKISDSVEYQMIELLRERYAGDRWEDTNPFEIAVQSKKEEINPLITLNNTYLRLEKIGFSRDLIKKIMTSSGGLNFNNSLDWALLFLDLDLLPPKYSDKYIHEGTNVGEMNFVPRNNKDLDNKYSHNKDSSSSMLSIPTIQKSKPLDRDLKEWILKSLEQESNEQDDKKIQPEIPTNIRYAQLKFQNEQLKTLLKSESVASDSNQILKIRNHMTQLKVEMDELIALNRDYNPRYVNDEYKKIVFKSENGNAKDKKKKKAELEGEEDVDFFLGDMFSTQTSPEKKSKSSVTKIRDMTYQNWTGKSPKQYLVDWLSKNAKLTKVHFQSLGGLGVRLRAVLKGGSNKDFEGKSIEMDKDEIMETKIEAENYASTKMLFLLVPHLSIYISLPPPFRDLWLDFQKREKLMETVEKKTLDVDRLTFIKSLFDIIEPKLISKSSNSKSSNSNHQPNSKALKISLEEQSKIFNQLSADFQSRKKTPAYLKMLKQRKDLPVYLERKTILETIQKNRVIVVAGETGSGKSTQIPQFVLEHAFDSNNSACNIPRRISALSIASRVSDEMADLKGPGGVGSAIGYQIRLESKTTKLTRLTFCTTGVLLRRLEADKDLAGVSHVVVDEVHERSLDSDFLLLLLKKVLNRRQDLTVILMSATADSPKFMKYFEDLSIACSNLTVSGRTFPVTSFFIEDAVDHTGYVVDYDSEFAKRDTHKNKHQQKVKISTRGGNSRLMRLEWDSSDSDNDDSQKFFEIHEESKVQYLSSTIKTLKKMDFEKINFDLVDNLIDHLNLTKLADDGDFKGSILVFLPGYGEIRKLYDRVSPNSEKLKYVVLPLHSQLGSNDQQKVFLPPPRGYRKIILSTNIAETGVTIPDVTYVIDTCRSREVGYDDRRHITRLQEVVISKANCFQRRGRAGRVREGICYHLVPSGVFKKLPSHRLPEIVRMPLEELCLRVRANGYTEPLLSFLSEAIDPPPEQNIKRSLEELIKVQAIDENEKLTNLGQILSNLPVDVRLGKMLLHSVVFSCLDPILTIASALSLGRSPFFGPFGNEELADKFKDGFKIGDSDLLTIVNCFEQWRSKFYEANGGQSAAIRFCEQKFLSYQNLLLIEETRGQLLKLLISVNSVDKDVIDQKRNRSVITTSIATKYNRNASLQSTVIATLTAGLYPNILKIVPDSNKNKPPGFVLQPPDSANTVFVTPHKQKSCFADRTNFAKTCNWLTYHSMTRVQSAGLNSLSKLRVWDLTRTSISLALLFSKKNSLDAIYSLEEGMVNILCSPRSMVALELFKGVFKKLVDERLVGMRPCDNEELVLEIFQALVKEDWEKGKKSLLEL